MDALPLTLVIISTFMHSTWNILLRYKGGTQTCLWRMQLSIVVLGAIPAFISLLTYPSITRTAILCLIGSGVSCGFYYFCLARGYESGDFTTVYPASRALPVLFIGIGDAFRGRPPNPLGWVGMIFVATGCFFVPLNSLSDFRFNHYWKPVSLWIVLTAFGTVGYSLFDKIGTEAIPRGPREAAVYCYFFNLMAFISSFSLKAFAKKPIKPSSEVGYWIPAIAGILCFLAYWLVLWSYQMVEKASYVVAFRQFSIVIGVLIAFLLFNEPGKKIRFVGSVVITAGLLLLKIFGV
ncbi:MAG: DMT family transporter [Methanosarcinaceae archaeon]|nr:DMT family transporter [Methanosarcinaceae archaeon]